jgi:hypothetical protein
MFDVLDARLKVTIGGHVYLEFPLHKGAVNISNSLRSNPVMGMLAEHLSNEDKEMMGVGA